MPKMLECRAVVPGCPFVAHGTTEADVVMRMIEHARAIHDVDHISPQLSKRIHAAIHDERKATSDDQEGRWSPS